MKLAEASLNALELVKSLHESRGSITKSKELLPEDSRNSANQLNRPAPNGSQETGDLAQMGSNVSNQSRFAPPSQAKSSGKFE